MTSRHSSTVFGGPVRDDLLIQLTTFLAHYLSSFDQNIEIEAKFGRIVERASGERISLPVLSECLIQEGDWFRFESDLSIEQHRHFNTLLNEQVTLGSGRLKYSHEKTVDRFYRKGSQRIRVSTGPNYTAAMKKQRLADVHLYLPNQSVDVRVSVNVEKPMSVPEIGSLGVSETERAKDRLSYDLAGHGIRVDLTQVQQKDGMAAHVKHELELEITNPATLINTLRSEDPKQLYQHTLVFLDNIRALAKNSI